MAHKPSKAAKIDARTSRNVPRNDRRLLTSTSKSARKLRKDVIEEDFGNVPIR